MNGIARDSQMTLLASSTATSDLTGSVCSPNTVQWVTDSYAIGRSAARAMMNRAGNSWYFLTVDFALGQLIQYDATEFIEASGGRVLGAVRHRLGITDSSSFLVRAQGSRAQVIELANASSDTGKTLKQTAEFGISRSQRLVAFLMFVNDVHAIGLPTAQGMQLVEAFYWDMNDGTRAFSRRFQERLGRPPSTNQAGVYSATLAYMHAVAQEHGRCAAGGAGDEARVHPAPLFGKVTVRQNGRAVHAMHLFEVKKPEESRGA